MSFDYRGLRTLREVSEDCPALPLNTLRYWVHHPELYPGIEEAIVRVRQRGSTRAKLMIHVPTFNVWLDSFRGGK